MNILICDDDSRDAHALKSIISKLIKNCNITIFDNSSFVLSFVNEEPPDICFLDIIMPNMSGVTLAKKMRETGFTGHIIFLSSSNDFATESYKVKASSYLLKPPDKNEVKRILNEIEEEIRKKDTEGIMVRNKTTSMFVFLRDISHIEVIGHKVYYRLLNNDEVYETARFSDVATKMLTHKRFAQCHRSFIVNMDEIYKLQEFTVIMKSGKTVPISRNFSEFSHIYVEYLFKERGI